MRGKHLDTAFKEHVLPRRKTVTEQKFVSIHFDAWQTHQREHVLAIYGVTGRGPELLASDIMEEKSHSHSEYLEHLDKAISDDMSVSAIVAGSESALQVRLGRLSIARGCIVWLFSCV